MSSGSRPVPVRWSIRWSWTGGAVGRTHITTRWSRSGPGAASATARRSPGGGPAGSPTSSGTRCSRRCALTGTRAIVALAVSNRARASEILGIRGVDLDWGEQLVRVSRKGSGADQWLPASPEAFVWIRLYLAEIGLPGPEEPIWRTLRRRGAGKSRGPLTYEALRAVFRRVNALLGADSRTPLSAIDDIAAQGVTRLAMALPAGSLDEQREADLGVRRPVQPPLAGSRAGSDPSGNRPARIHGTPP